MASLEDYLTGKPVSEENAELLHEIEAEPQADQLDWDYTGALDKNERGYLRRLTGEPGFPILVRLLANLIQEREDAARLVSTNPLENQQAMVEAWTYVAAIKAVRNDLLLRIQAEIAGVPVTTKKELE